VVLPSIITPTIKCRAGLPRHSATITDFKHLTTGRKRRPCVGNCAELKVMSEKLKKPTVTNIVGILTCISEIVEENLTLLTIQDAEDNVVTIGTSTAYWKKAGKHFSEDRCVKATYEHRIAGVTGYIPKGETEMLAHEGNGLQLTNITAYSKDSFERTVKNLSKDADIQTITSVETDRASSVAAYLAAYVK